MKIEDIHSGEDIKSTTLDVDTTVDTENTSFVRVFLSLCLIYAK
jgi:hypothetical protein